MSSNPRSGLIRAIGQWRRRPRSTESKFAMLTNMTKGAMLLAFPLYLTPSEYRKNPRIQRTFTWISLGIAAIYFFKAAILFFYRAGGYDLPSMIPDVVPGISGTAFFQSVMWLCMATLFAATAGHQWFSDHLARIAHKMFGWDPVRPARFGFYLVHSLGGWVWMAVGLGTLGLIALPAIAPMWTAINPRSPVACALVLAGGVATMLISFRRQTVQQRIALEIYGSAEAARRATLLFQLLPTLTIFALMVVAAKARHGLL